MRHTAAAVFLALAALATCESALEAAIHRASLGHAQWRVRHAPRTVQRTADGVDVDLPAPGSDPAGAVIVADGPRPMPPLLAAVFVPPRA